jgi:GalNAc-alpha-(1->4)-GalNAc-alpha-(1->3)-diNAcBac-PP-undecaprenol alpha-1,4-N-acetyl-D-galactosaminyltransferase
VARIAVVIHSLTGGGSEHVAARMASWWADHGHEASLLTLDSVENDTIPISSAVRRIGLGLMSESSGLLSAVLANRRRVRQLRRALLETNAEHVVSLTDRMNVVTLLACRGTQLQPVVSERIDIRHHAIGRLWSWLRRRTYPRAKAVVVQTAGIRDAVLPIAGRAPVEVIPNCVWPSDENSSPGQFDLKGDRRWLASVGRFDHQKGFDRLLDAFGLIADRHPNWNLVLIGDGSQRSDLESQIESLRLADRVLLPGWVENPWRALGEQADAYALSSRYEGFPNALLEAMSVGLCPVAFDCPSGPAEIIQHETNGLLVASGDVAALAESLDRVMTNDALRQRLADKAKNVREQFSVERYFEQWNALLGIS